VIEIFEISCIFLYLPRLVPKKELFSIREGERENFSKEVPFFCVPRDAGFLLPPSVSRSLSVGVSFGEKVKKKLRTQFFELFVTSRQILPSKKRSNQFFWTEKRKEKILLWAVHKEIK